MIIDTPICEKHSDCHFFDCKGQCDLINQKCINGVVNNNLQVRSFVSGKTRGESHQALIFPVF